MYSSSFALGIPDRGAVARAQDVQVALAQPAQAVEIAGERAGVGGDEDAAFAEHRVAGEAHPAGDQREVIGGVAGRGEGHERPEASPLGELHVDLAPPRGQRRGTPLAQSADPLGVVGVVVRERDAAEPAARVDGRHEALDVLLRARDRDRPRRRGRGRRSRCWCPTASAGRGSPRAGARPRARPADRPR